MKDKQVATGEKGSSIPAADLQVSVAYSPGSDQNFFPLTYRKRMATEAGTPVLCLREGAPSK